MLRNNLVQDGRNLVFGNFTLFSYDMADNFKFDNMKTGNYKSQLNVYGRENLHCNNCNKDIVKIKVSGRGTYICPHCQRQ